MVVTATAHARIHVDLERQISAAFPMMNAEITTKKVGTKWHGYIEGRPNLDERALSEEAVRRKMEQLCDRIGTCAARTKLFGGRTCELIDGHRVLGKTRIEHRSGEVTWTDGPT